MCEDRIQKAVSIIREESYWLGWCEQAVAGDHTGIAKTESIRLSLHFILRIIGCHQRFLDQLGIFQTGSSGRNT